MVVLGLILGVLALDEEEGSFGVLFWQASLLLTILCCLWTLVSPQVLAFLI